MLIVLVAVISVSPIIMTVGWIKFNLDPYYYLLSGIIKNKVINILVRTFLLSGLGEAGRCLCHVSCGMCLTWTNYYKCLTSLQRQHTNISTMQGIQIYSHLLLTWKLMHKPIEKISSLLLTVAFWGGTLVIWMMIRFAAYIPFVIYIWFGLAAMGLLGSVVGAISVVAVIRELSENVVKMFRESGRLNIIKAKCSKSKEIAKYEWRKAIASKPFRIPFHPFLYVNRKFALDYLNTMRDRVVDALLIL